MLPACGGSGAASSSSTAASSAPATVASSSAAKATPASTSSTQAAAPTNAPKPTTTPAAAASSSAAKTTVPANAPKPTPTPAAGETHKGAATTIDLWYGWGGADSIQTWGVLGKQMGQDLTGFNVHWEVANNNTKLLTAIAGGSPPNVAFGNAPYPEFWARGAANQLDGLIARSKVTTRADIAAPYWAYASYKGKTYGVPAGSAFMAYALCLDMTNLQKYGIDPKTHSWDWDTLTQLQQQLTQTASDGSIAMIGFDPLDAMGGAASGGNPFYWAQAWQVDYFDENAGTFNYDNEQFIAAMTTVKKVRDIAGGPQKISGFYKSYGQWTDSPAAAFPAGVEDMEINGYWTPGTLAHSAPHREFAYTWAPVPAAHKGYKFQSTANHNAFIPKGAKNIDQSFQLIEYLVGDTAEEIMFNGEGWVGPRQSFLQKVDVSKYHGLDFYINSAKQNDKLNGILSNPIEGFCATQWNKALQNVLYGKSQPKDALTQLQQQVTNEMQQQFPNG